MATAKKDVKVLKKEVEKLNKNITIKSKLKEHTEKTISKWRQEIEDPSTEENKKKQLQINAAKYEEYVDYFDKKISSMQSELGEVVPVLQAKRAESAYSSTATCRMFDKAMKKEVETKRKRSAIVGLCGVGKTHLLALLMGEEPPSKRVSTSVSEVPKRIGHLKIQGETGSSYRRITSDEYSQMVMKSSREVVFRSSSQGGLSGILASVREKFFKPRSPSEAVEEDLKIRLHEAEETEAFLHDKVILEMRDSGGQPQFLELLPKFLSHLSLLVIVTNISQRFDEYPTAYFFGRDGNRVGKGFPCRLTNEQLLSQLLQMVASMSRKRSIRFMFVGTHRDLECSESMEEKEDKLLKMIQSFDLENNVIYNSEGFDRVIFAVNGKDPNLQDYETGKKIMEKIMDEKYTEEISMPVKYHCLELVVRQMAAISHHIAIPLSHIMEKVSRYHFDNESLKCGLKFLNESNHILYFEKEFPDIIIGDPQILLDKITKVVERHIQMTTDPSESRPAEGIWKKFKEQGIICNEILSEYPEGYVKEIFTAADMLRMLEVMLIVFEINPGEYLMPCLLTAERSFPAAPESSVIPLLLHFPSGTAGLGVFCSTVCHLIAVNKWKLLEGSVVARNRFQFRLLDRPGYVTLDDSFDSYFVVYISVPSVAEHILPSLCVEVRDTLIIAINKVTEKLNYDLTDLKVAFFCEKHQSSSLSNQATASLALSPHGATVSKGGLLVCIKDSNESYKLTENHQIWLKAISLNLSHISRLKGSDKDGNLRILENICINWKDIGGRLGITGTELAAIDRKCLRDPLECCREIMTLWIEKGRGHDEYPPTWNGLLELLRDIEYNNLAMQVKEALSMLH